MEFIHCVKCVSDNRNHEVMNPFSLTLQGLVSCYFLSSLFVELFVGEFTQGDSTEKRWAPYDDIEGFMGYVAVTFSIFSYSNISLIWWEGKLVALSVSCNEISTFHASVTLYSCSKCQKFEKV